MQSILSRYMQSIWLKSLGIVALVFAGLGIFVQWVRESDHIGQGSYGLWQALQVIAQGLPAFLYDVWPIILLLGSLIGLGALASAGELLVIRSSGVSLGRLMRALLPAVLLVLGISTWIGEWKAPVWARHATLMRTQALSGKQQVVPHDEALWVEIAGFHVFVQKVLDDTHWEGVYWVSMQGKDLQAEKHMGHADAVVKQDGMWVGESVEQWRMTPEGHVEAKILPTSVLPFQDKTHEVAHRPALSTLTLPELWHALKKGEAHHHNTRKEATHVWTRVLKPLLCFLMIWVSVPFVSGPLREVSLGVRLISGIGLGFLFYVLNRMMLLMGLLSTASPWFLCVMPSLSLLLLLICLSRSVF